MYDISNDQLSSTCLPRLTQVIITYCRGCAITI